MKKKHGGDGQVARALSLVLPPCPPGATNSSSNQLGDPFSVFLCPVKRTKYMSWLSYSMMSWCQGQVVLVEDHSRERSLVSDAKPCLPEAARALSAPMRGSPSLLGAPQEL